MLGVSNGLAAGPGTLLYGALIGLATVAILSGVLLAQWRRVTSAAAKTDVFETWASARGPQPPEGDLIPAGVGLVRGPVGRLRVDRRGVVLLSERRRRGRREYPQMTDTDAAPPAQNASRVVAADPAFEGGPLPTGGRDSGTPVMGVVGPRERRFCIAPSPDDVTQRARVQRSEDMYVTDRGLAVGGDEDLGRQVAG